MDLSTVRGKLVRHEYSDIVEFNKDMELIWSNAKKFNRPSSDIFKKAETLARLWGRTFAVMENDPALSRTGKLKTIRSRKEKSQRVYNCKTRTVKGKRHQPQVRGSRCIEVDVTSTSIDERLKEPKILWEFKGVKERKYS